MMNSSSQQDISQSQSLNQIQLDNMNQVDTQMVETSSIFLVLKYLLLLDTRIHQDKVVIGSSCIGDGSGW
jgi:hypothetical protein